VITLSELSSLKPKNNLDQLRAAILIFENGDERIYRSGIVYFAERFTTELRTLLSFW
jgi:hypothetical protein